MKIGRQIAAFLRLQRLRRSGRSGPVSHARGPVTHVVILDGTLSTLEPGHETNAGLTWRLLAEGGPRADRSLYYEAGLQWDSLPGVRDVITGRGLNRQIARAYGFLASRYRPGDRIFLFGFSRGAFAVRSLAGAIYRVGLPRAEMATTRVIEQAYRHYRCSAADSEAARTFTQLYCHANVPIEVIGVWDTVKALGLRLPLAWRFTEPTHAFHTHELCPNVQRGYHALARDETRLAFAPEMWDTRAHPGRVEQRWFRGTHGDVGGQLKGFMPARPLSNISLVWILDRAEAAGLELPDGWRVRFPQDPTAPNVSAWRGWGKAFLLRRPRDVGRDTSEVIDPSVGAPRRKRRLGFAGHAAPANGVEASEPVAVRDPADPLPVPSGTDLPT